MGIVEQIVEPVYGIYSGVSDDFQRGPLKDLSRCIKAKQHDVGVIKSVKIKQATKEGYIECKLGGVADLSYPTSTTRRERVQDNGDVCPTLTATETGVCRIEKAPITTTKGKTDIACTQMANYYRSNMSGFVTENAVYETPYRIRKLTPLECWRLMSFTDEDFHKAEQVNSNTQLYKQAGNSIVVNVLEGIFKQMM